MTATIQVTYDYIYNAHCGTKNSPTDTLAFFTGRLTLMQGKILSAASGDEVISGRVECTVKAEICRTAHQLLVENYDLFIVTVFGSYVLDNQEIKNLHVSDGEHAEFLAQAEFIKNFWK